MKPLKVFLYFCMENDVNSQNTTYVLLPYLLASILYDCLHCRKAQRGA